MAAGVPLDDEEIRREFFELMKAQMEALDRLASSTEALNQQLGKDAKAAKKKPKAGTQPPSDGGGNTSATNNHGEKSPHHMSIDDDSIERLGKIIGTHLQAAATGHAEPGPSGHDDKQTGAESAQKSRLTQRLDNDLHRTLKTLPKTIVQETNRMVTARLNEFANEKIIQPLSNFASGGFFLDQLEKRMESGADAASRNLGGVVDAFTNNFQSLWRGFNDYDKTLKTITRNLQNNGTAYSTFQGGLGEFGKGLKSLKGNMNQINVDRNMNSEQQNDYLAGLYDQQVRMGISNKLETNFMKDTSVAQMAMFKRIANNTGRTVEEIIQANRQAELPKTAADIVAQMGLSGQEATNITEALSAFTPEQLAYYGSKGDLAKFMKDYRATGNLDFASGQMINSASEENKYDVMQFTRSLGPVLARAMSGERVDANQIQRDIARGSDAYMGGAQAEGGVGLLLRPNMGAGDANVTREQADKLGQSGDESKGFIEGIINRMGRSLEGVPFLKEIGAVGSGIAGLVVGGEQLISAVKANTFATWANTTKLGLTHFPGLKGLLGRLGGGGAAAAGAGAAGSAGGAAAGAGGAAAGAGGLAAGGLLAGALGGLAGLAGMVFSNVHLAKQKGESFFGSREGEGGLMGSRASGYAGSAASGALAGAAIGSIVPVVGTALGAVVGGAVGLISAAVVDNWDKIKSGAKKGWEGLKRGVSGFFNMSQTLSKFMRDGMTYNLRRFSNGAVGFMERLTGRKFDNMKFDMKDGFSRFVGGNRTPAIVDRPVMRNPTQMQDQFRSRQAELIRTIQNDGVTNNNGFSDQKLIEELRSSRALNAEMLRALEVISRNTRGSPNYNTAV